MAAYRALVYETPGFTDYFFGLHADPRDRRAQHRLASRVAQGQPENRGLARHPLGFSQGQCRHAAGLVRLRRGGRPS